ncbi:MAG: aromatic ring-hydroxylating dioxygenase subunit alpha [Deltaproteobacteria bacterium]|nr:MAG: aromatic ring-hydroxylating dioxygenase subunit alpha [Deltaproteobacteria bacterium]TMA55277.1 MAG: aromatic ring-hydroxylating dioxygenase subunit alpha [Deltaproteobacteria bacterium]
MDGTLTIDGLDLSAPPPGRCLPAGAFTSAAVFEAELGRIFARSWMHVADLPELCAAGDFVAATIGTTPVVVVRGHDGELRGFLNACRHRGTTLAEGRGNCGRQLRCPYHAWSYATDGRLVGVPERQEFAHCDLGAMGLVPIRLATLGPMVFGCLDAAAPAFKEWAGELAEALGRARGAEMELAFDYVYDVPVNWKVYVENGLEGYHVPIVHDFLNDFVATDGARHFFEPHGSYTHARIRPEFLATVPPLAHLSAEEQGTVRFGHLFPNLIPVIAPADFSYLRIDPLGPERIRLVARSFDLGGELAALRELRREALDRTNQQDIGAVTRVQRGLHASRHATGVHSSFLEERIGHFERMVSRALAA